MGWPVVWATGMGMVMWYGCDAWRGLHRLSFFAALRLCGAGYHVGVAQCSTICKGQGYIDMPE